MPAAARNRSGCGVFVDYVASCHKADHSNVPAADTTVANTKFFSRGVHAGQYRRLQMKGASIIQSRFLGGVFTNYRFTLSATTKARRRRINIPSHKPVPLIMCGR
jgi:hypothetical protein